MKNKLIYLVKILLISAVYVAQRNSASLLPSYKRKYRLSGRRQASHLLLC